MRHSTRGVGGQLLLLSNMLPTVASDRDSRPHCCRPNLECGLQEGQARHQIWPRVIQVATEEQAAGSRGSEEQHRREGC